MIENIKIGSIKKIKNPKNKYRIYSYVMYGDADLYQINSIDVDLEEALLFWNLISVYFELGLDKKNRSNHNAERAFEERGRELGIEYASEYYYELIGGDVTVNSEYLARLKSMWMTYFDENGIEYNIDIPEKLGSYNE
jgi:hypothetical protein